MLSAVAMAFSLAFLNPANIKLPPMPQVKSPFVSQPKQVDSWSVRKADWTVNIRRDNFTKTTTCSLKTHTVEVRDALVIFYLGTSVDTDDAFFRLDNGPARSVGEAARQDEKLGYFSGRGPIDNPSGGEVALPRDYLGGARTVTIRATPHSKPRLFDLSQLPTALAAAKAGGCPVELL